MPKFYDDIDIRRNELKHSVIHKLTGIPTGLNIEGQIYYDENDDALKLCTTSGTTEQGNDEDNGVWIEIADTSTYTALSAGGVSVDAAQQFSLNFNGLGDLAGNSGTPATGDFIAVYDIDTSLHKKVTYSELVAGLGGGSMDNWVLKDDDGDAETISNGKHVKFVGGNGLSTDWVNSGAGSSADEFDMQMSVNATQSHITQIYNTDLKVGHDDQTQIDFTTDNTIIFDVDDVELGRFSSAQATFNVDTFLVSSANVNDPVLTIRNSNEDAKPAALMLEKVSASPFAGDDIGQLLFRGKNDTPAAFDFAKIVVESTDITATSEQGKMTLSVAAHQQVRPGIVLQGSATLDEVDVTIGNGANSFTTISGKTQMNGALTVGVNDDGKGDVQFFGETSGNYFLWDESADDLILHGTSIQTKFGSAAGSGNDVYFYTAGTAAHVGLVWDADGETEGRLVGGANGHGVDFIFYGETSGKFLHWDMSEDELVLGGASKISFHDQGGDENITASADGHLEINAGTTLDMTAPTVDINCSTEMQVDTVLFDLNASGDVEVNAVDVKLTGTGEIDLTAPKVDINASTDVHVTTPTFTIQNSATSTPKLQLKTTHTTPGNSAELQFIKDSEDLATGEDLGKILWKGEDPSVMDGSLLNYAKLFVETSNITATDEAGKLSIDILAQAGDGTNTLRQGATFTGSGTSDIVDVGLGHGATSTTTTAGHLAVTGDLTVSGTTTTVNSTTVTIDDPIFTLGGDSNPSADDNKDRGIEFRYHNGSSALLGFFGWDDSATEFTGYTAATNTSEVFSGTRMNANFGIGTFASLDVSGNVEAGTITVDGATLEETVEDFVGGMLGGTEEFIAVTYQDSTGDIDFVVAVKDEDDMASDSDAHLATQQSIKAYVLAQSAAANTNLSTVTSVIDISESNFANASVLGGHVAVITHSLGTLQPIVQLWEQDDDNDETDQIHAKVECISDAAISVTFGSLPTHDVRVTIIDPGTNNIDPTYS